MGGVCSTHGGIKVNPVKRYKNGNIMESPPTYGKSKLRNFRLTRFLNEKVHKKFEVTFVKTDPRLSLRWNESAMRRRLVEEYCWAITVVLQPVR